MYTVLGTSGAWLLYRYRYPGVRVLQTLIFIPMIVPEVILGVSCYADLERARTTDQRAR